MTETEPSAPPPERRAGWRGYYTKTRAAITAAVALLLSIVALAGGVLDLFPGLRDEPCASERDPVITQPQLGKTVTLKQAHELQGASNEGLSAQRLAQPGKTVSFDLVAVGLRGDRIQLRARVRVAGGGPLVRDLEVRDQLVAEVRPTACKDRRHLDDVWVAIPAAPGRYVIEIRARAPDGEWLDAAPTRPFTT